MTNATETLNVEIRHLASELRRLEHRLRVEPDPDADALNEFRQSIDNARLTAWSVSELVSAHRTSKNRNTALAFVAAERLRRFEQLAKNICTDIEGHGITLQPREQASLLESVEALRQLLLASSVPANMPDCI
jgi:hypothetical protein